MPTMCLVAATPMHAVDGVSDSIVSRRLGEVFQHLQIGWSSPSGITSENLQGLHASTAAAFCLAVGVSFGGSISRHYL